MGKGIGVSNLLRPLDEVPTQCFLGTGLHTLGLLGWILEQTGKADVWVSTFSTSDAFLCGFLNLKRRGLVGRSVLMADMKASRKTMQLYRLMHNCFDRVLLSMNHSKVVLVQTDTQTVTVITSQNQTYGDRAECTMVTTDSEAFFSIRDGFEDIAQNKSMELDGLFKRLSGRDKEGC